MNLEKHKKNLIQECLEGVEDVAPAHSRSAHVLKSFVKIPRPVSRKFRANLPNKPDPAPEPALMREPAPPAKTEKHSQAAAPDHLRKQERLSQLRAPYKRG